MESKKIPPAPRKGAKGPPKRTATRVELPPSEVARSTAAADARNAARRKAGKPLKKAIKRGKGYKQKAKRRANYPQKGRD